MIWLLRDLDLASELTRALLLSFEILALGGALYLLFLGGDASEQGAVDRACRRGIRAAAIGLLLSAAVSLAVSASELLNSASMGARQLFRMPFFIAGLATILLAALLWAVARRAGSEESGPWLRRTMALTGLLLVASTVATSHAVASPHHRAALAIFTAVHQVGAAAWLGAMPFLLIALQRSEAEWGRAMARRFTWMALPGAAALILGGIGMAWFYVGSWNGLYGTTYGVLLCAKIYLLLVMAALGAGNWYVARRMESNPKPLLAHIRRFAEVEIGLGFLAVLAAASLTAQPPAADVTAHDRVTPSQIYARMHPVAPRMTSPSESQLTPATSMRVAIEASQFQPMAASDARDRAWSEYNHHWAGIVVLLAAFLAGLSRIRGIEWARFWPLSFAGLAVFIVLRADPENWPLGPRPFWASFSAPDVLEHRVAAALILAFAVFECAVQADKLRVRWAGAIFPAMCILGAAILLVHDHASQSVKEELFGEMSHVPIALMGLSAGWGRWLELRLPEGRAARIAGYLWPVFLAGAGLILLGYREI